MRILLSLFPFFGPFLNADPAAGSGGGSSGNGGGQTSAPSQPQAANQQPQSQPQPQPSTPQPPQPGGRTFSEDYVQALRQEAAGYRTRMRALEDAARRALGLKDGDNLPDNLADALVALRTAGQQEAAADLQTAKTLYAQGLFAAAGAGKVVDTDAAFALVAQAGYTVEVDLKTKALTVKGADGKALADKDGKALTGKDAMAALVDKLIEKYPFLKAAGGGAPSQVGGTAPGGGSGGSKDPKELAKQIAEERAKARGTGGTSSFWGRRNQ